MRSLVRLRVELDDQPGALAGVAAAIAARDGNITAIDVLEAEGGRVVDEFTVDVPDDLDMTRLRLEIAGARDARVLSLQRTGLVDPIVRVLRHLTAALDRLPRGAADELCQGIADLCGTPAVLVLDAGSAAAYDVGRHALEDPGRAVMAHAAEELPSFGEAMTGDLAVVAVATTISGAPVVVLAARPLAQGFTSTECHRIEALAVLHERLVAVVDSAHAEAGGPGVR
jgi:23S rRNA U2552 (ribose-2'-O)-methylase RlmE/FtsJ